MPFRTPGPRVRPFIFWPHLILGIAAGLVILVMAVTGVLLTYQRQILQWADSAGAAPPAPGAAPLPLAALVARAGAAYPPRPSPGSGQRAAQPPQITIRRDMNAPAQISLNGHTVFVNRYSGAVLGEGATGVRAFFRSVTNWHRWLALEGRSRQTARVVTGASNLIFLLLAVSGLYLWWPRRWTIAALRNITVFRRGLTPKARDFNWHNVFGFWMAIPIVLVAGSGVVLSYSWAGNLVYRLAGEAPPSGRGAAAPSQPSPDAAIAGGTATMNLDALLSVATSREPDWTSVSFRYAPAATPVSFSIDRGTGGQPQMKSTLTLDAVSGAPWRYERFSDQSRGRRWRSWLRFIHTGEAGGLWGQTLAGLASLAGVALVYSGFALSWRRFFSKHHRTARHDRTSRPHVTTARDDRTSRPHVTNARN